MSDVVGQNIQSVCGTRLVEVKTVLIVAMSENFVIGVDGKLPWHLPNDLKFFKEQTTGHPLVVGRKTFESMPSFVWKTRHPHILTRNPEKLNVPEGQAYHACSDLASLVNSAKANHNTGAVFIAGGSEVYRLALELDLVDEMLVTHVKGNYEGDTFFQFVPGFGRGEVLIEDDDFTVCRYLRYVPKDGHNRRSRMVRQFIKPTQSVPKGADGWTPNFDISNQSQDFALGAEFGMVWQRLNSNSFQTMAVRCENCEMLKEAALHFGYIATFTETDVEGWMNMEVERAK